MARGAAAFWQRGAYANVIPGTRAGSIRCLSLATNRILQPATAAAIPEFLHHY